MLSAESAVLVHFQSVRTILLVFGGVVVSLLALGACQGNFSLHSFHLVLPISKPVLAGKPRKINGSFIHTNKTSSQRYK